MGQRKAAVLKLKVLKERAKRLLIKFKLKVIDRLRKLDEKLGDDSPPPPEPRRKDW